MAIQQFNNYDLLQNMKKKLKKIGKISAIVLGVILLLLIVTPILFKGKILQIVKNEANKNLNGELYFDDLKLSLFKGFPALNVKIIDLYFVGIEEFENDTLIKFNYLSTNVNLASVIFGDQIKINKIVLDEPDIYIKVLKNGKANYDIVKEDSTATDEPEDENSAEETEDESSFALTLKKLKINKANIVYDDQESDLLADISNLNFQLSGDLTETRTSLDLLLLIDELSLNSEGVRYVDRANLKFDSEIDADIENSVYTLKENLLKINEIELGFDGFVAMPDTVNTEMDITFSAKKTEFKSLLSMIPAVYEKDFEDIETSGVFELSGFAKGTYNDNQIPAFGIDLKVDNAWFQYPDLPQAVTDISIDLHVENPGNEDVNIVDLRKLHLAMAKNPVDIKLYLKTSKYDVYTNGNINAKIDFNTVTDFYPLEDMTLSGSLATNVNFKGNISDIEKEQYNKFDASGNLTISDMKTTLEDLPPIHIYKTDLHFSPQMAHLKEFKAQIGKSDVELSGQIDNIFQYVFSNEGIKAEFDFNSKLFDVNDFLSYDQSETETDGISSSNTSEITETESEEGEISAFEIPNNINLTLNSKIDKVNYEKLEITNVIGLITLQNSTLSLDKLDINLLDGTMKLSASYDASDYLNPQVSASLGIQDIDLIKTYNSFLTVQKLVPIIENCNGAVSAILQVDTKLDQNLNPIYNTMNGYGSFASSNISISNNKFFGILANVTQMERYKNPALQNVNIEFEITNGNIEILPAQLLVAGSKFSIEGITNLDKTIDFQLGMVLPNNKAQGLVDNLPFVNLPDEIEVYAQVGGTIDEPTIEDFSTNLLDNTKDELSEAAKKYIAQVQQQADKLVADAKAKKEKLVKDAQNKVNQIKNAAKQEADRLLAQAKAEGDKLIAEANNPVARELAKKAADKLYSEAKKQADKKINEANGKVKNLVTDASKNGDKLVRDAERQADKMVKDAEKKAENM